MEEAMIERLIQRGFNINISPERLVSEWLGIDTIGYKVEVLKGFDIISSSTHRILQEALEEALDKAFHFAMNDEGRE